MNGFEVFHCIPPVLVSYEDDEETLVCFCFPSNSRKTNWNSYENICVVLQYRRTNASLKNFCSYFWEFHLNVCMFFLLQRRRLNWISLALGSFRGVWIVWLWNDKLTLRELTLMYARGSTRIVEEIYIFFEFSEIFSQLSSTNNHLWCVVVAIKLIFISSQFDLFLLSYCCGGPVLCAVV